ncbi:hypothetical protein ACH41H_47220 [Streptomyces sp. NPDC020800]|uniref:hypothetical protein n=1 Tax=Streptomyces sp. NPDC020800 TaxID=3365092 RepID=UPI0037BDC17F
MLLEVVPLLLGGPAVLLLRSISPALVEEAVVGPHQVVLEDRKVCLSGGRSLVSEDAGGDVDGSPPVTASASNILRKSCGV